MNRTKSALLPFLVLALVLTGCSGDSTAPIVPVPPEIVVAPSQITIGAATLHLTPYLWRDFQPPVNSEPALLAQLRVQADGGVSIPTGLYVEKAWFVFENQAWLATPRQEGPAPNTGTLEVMARGGPPWPVGALVTVVVQVRDANNGSYLLRAAPQAIGRTD